MKEDAAILIVTIAMYFIFLGLGCHAGYGVGRKDGREYELQDWKDWSVNTGHAEYYLDEAHNRQWRWLPTEGSK